MVDVGGAMKAKLKEIEDREQQYRDIGRVQDDN
jgi:hypothetical protein